MNAAEVENGEWLVTMESVNAAQVAVKSLSLAGCKAYQMKEDEKPSKHDEKVTKVVDIEMEESRLTVKKSELKSDQKCVCRCCFNFI